MNNPPDISPVEHETEEYAHEVRAHVRRYLMVGATLLAFTAITVALSYVNFGWFYPICFIPISRGSGTQSERTVALLVATFKAGTRRRHLHALVGGKAPDLSRPHFHRLFRPWTFLAHLPCLVRPHSPLMSIKGFHIVFIVFSTLLALGIGCYCVWVDLTVGEPVYRTGAIASFVSAVVLIVYGILFYRKMKRLRLIT